MSDSCLPPRTTGLSFEMSLYADLVGPAVAVLNVSGIGAHGRRSEAELRAELGHMEQKGRAAPVLIIDQLEQGTLVPLGWYLSAPARHALDEQS